MTTKNTGIYSLEELWSFLRDHRKGEKISQKDMNALIGMTQQQYQKTEASSSDLLVSTLLRILEGLNAELIIAPKGKGEVLYKLLECIESGELNEQLGAIKISSAQLQVLIKNLTEK